LYSACDLPVKTGNVQEPLDGALEEQVVCSNPAFLRENPWPFRGWNIGALPGVCTPQAALKKTRLGTAGKRRNFQEQPIGVLIVSPLLRSKNLVTCVAKLRNDVADFVEMTVHCYAAAQQRTSGCALFKAATPSGAATSTHDGHLVKVKVKFETWGPRGWAHCHPSHFTFTFHSSGRTLVDLTSATHTAIIFLPGR